MNNYHKAIDKSTVLVVVAVPIEKRALTLMGNSKMPREMKRPYRHCEGNY